ncbi:DUF6248 family natural product biosynthesis protein [Streptomyces sp. NPDC007205]|uniref:DUF6248 family natural product biosynthesis protein n=1 Tax=Streptomyces sp. NPDC007205 TaxID=3154316 RepID=UPI0033E240B4
MAIHGLRHSAFELKGNPPSSLIVDPLTTYIGDNMTTWLRSFSASITGLLDAIPSAVPSPMSREEAAWVRSHAWTPALRRIERAHPNGFHRWCACERGFCHPCRAGYHDQCASTEGPALDDRVGTMTDLTGVVVAAVLCGPGRRPCRWLCPCAHQRARREEPQPVRVPVGVV